MNRARWTPAQDSRLRELYPDHLNSSIAILMRRSEIGIIGRAFKLKLRKSDAYKERLKHTEEKFIKGHIPFNKGRKISEYLSPEAIQNCKKTQFKPGQRPAIYKGGTLNRQDNTLYVYRTGKRVALKRWVWQQNFGEIPPGMAICCKDGNPYNCDPSNLEMRRIGFNAAEHWAQLSSEQRRAQSQKIWETRRRNKYGVAYFKSNQPAPVRTPDEETMRRRMKLDCMPNPFEFLSKTDNASKNDTEL